MTYRSTHEHYRTSKSASSAYANVFLFMCVCSVCCQKSPNTVSKETYVYVRVFSMLICENEHHVCFSFFTYKNDSFFYMQTQKQIHFFTHSVLAKYAWCFGEHHAPCLFRFYICAILVFMCACVVCKYVNTFYWVSKETYYSVKRDLLQCQKRPITVDFGLCAPV
jgi:hypothetical protein